MASLSPLPRGIRGITYPIFVAGFAVKIFIPHAMFRAKENRIVAAFRIGRIAGAFNSRDTRGRIEGGGKGKSRGTEGVGPASARKGSGGDTAQDVRLGRHSIVWRANAFKMAGSVRSPLIAAKLGYGGDGRVASRDL